MQENGNTWDLGPDMKSLKCCTGEPTFFFPLEKMMHLVFREIIWCQRDGTVQWF